MLDRYTITLQPNELSLVLGAEVPSEYQPHYNAAPTKSLPVITSQKKDKVRFFSWGLMTKWSNNKTMSPKFYNISLESVLAKPNYRKKLANQRCAIPMDGFYIWKQVAKKQQIPHYFFFPDRKVFCVAGFWEENEEEEYCFIMITREATGTVAMFQEDMPAIMDIGSTKKWLESTETGEIEQVLLREATFDLLFHTVSPGIGQLDANEVAFIQPTPASDQHGNYTLFS